MVITKKYLVFPVSDFVKVREIDFYNKDKLLDDIYIKLDYINPKYNIYYPVEKYKGMNIDVIIHPDIDFRWDQTDEPDYTFVYNCPFRPKLHFTAAFGWLNDPNGLFEYTSKVTGEKVYNMYFQYNPYGNIWGNIHWGHAVSKDLLHWEQKSSVLAPDELGMIFSGSAVVDSENRSGLKSGEEDVILIYYTAAGGTNKLSENKKFTQCIAYSNDCGRTFVKYKENPVIQNVGNDNRDPKVVWCEEMQCYVMALYLKEGTPSFGIFTSRDLLHWEFLQEMVIDGDAECPDLYPIYVQDGERERKWVITAASGKYIICECSENGFQIIQQAMLLNYTLHSYAAQTFYNVSDDRIIRMSWNRDVFFPESPFSQQMSIPYDIVLKKKDNLYILCAKPIKELEKLICDKYEIKNISISENKEFKIPLKKSAYIISVGIAREKFENLTISFFDCAVNMDSANNQAVCGDKKIPLCVYKNTADLSLIVDKCSIELISSDGAATMTIPAICDYNIDSLVISSSSSAELDYLTVSELESVYNA